MVKCLLPYVPDLEYTSNVLKDEDYLILDTGEIINEQTGTGVKTSYIKLSASDDAHYVTVEITYSKKFLLSNYVIRIRQKRSFISRLKDYFWRKANK